MYGRRCRSTGVIGMRRTGDIGRIDRPILTTKACCAGCGNDEPGQPHRRTPPTISGQQTQCGDQTDDTAEEASKGYSDEPGTLVDRTIHGDDTEGSGGSGDRLSITNLISISFIIITIV